MPMYCSNFLKLYGVHVVDNPPLSVRREFTATRSAFLMILMELGGSPLSAKPDNSLHAHQSIRIMKQVIFWLFVANSKFKFAHQDLHCGNVLIGKTKDVLLQYSIGQKNISINSKGILVKVCDYSESVIDGSADDVKDQIPDFEKELLKKTRDSDRKVVEDLFKGMSDAKSFRTLLKIPLLSGNDIDCHV
ncbi:Protein kinase domain-containing protein [Caenorhabditis elegans]|uniref:Protein kinase domain-containing protein n=1 Tax=Caenorhabditis elegans TaxID=6239 RepID=Q17723_CAEEL|nr:Protein kinase domain-containing protein [Caenorhabditis elegans]CCD63340.2 Protein kinase domain-containing protein [Caenorhabditis elegans]|eukprot:NP_501153.2 Uncharacterized protein CELE_C06E4.5 [Caenorhabditis elegans]